jgi:hypothetical protein
VCCLLISHRPFITDKLEMLNTQDYVVQTTPRPPPPPAGDLAHIQHQSFGNILNSKPIIERVQPYLILNDGNRMPLIGLGTWNAQGKELTEAVREAIRAGYRHIDTAANYKNEHLVGEAIRDCIDEGLVRREDLFVTTKLWNNSHSRASVPAAIKRSLEALQLDYVDLFLVHYPIGYKEGDVLSPLDSSGQVITSDVDYVDTWRGMEDCKRLALTKSIGVSNFNAEQLSRVLCNCTIIPTMNQVRGATVKRACCYSKGCCSNLLWARLVVARPRGRGQTNLTSNSTLRSLTKNPTNRMSGRMSPVFDARAPARVLSLARHRANRLQSARLAGPPRAGKEGATPDRGPASQAAGQEVPAPAGTHTH